MTPIYRDLGPTDLKPRLDAAGVNRIVVVQAAETLAEALFILGLAREYSWIAGVVAWVDPASPAIKEELAALSWNPRVKGVRPVRDDNRSIAWMLDTRLDAGWRALTDAGLALDILVQNWRELNLATVLARRLGDVKIVLDHCAKPDIAGGRFEPWATEMADFAQLPNVFCKLSGLLNCAAPDAGVTEIRPYTAHVLDVFGAERVMWASDWPPLDLASDYATWKRLADALLVDLSAAEGAAVFGGTAHRIYGLE